VEKPCSTSLQEDNEENAEEEGSNRGKSRRRK